MKKEITPEDTFNALKRVPFSQAKEIAERLHDTDPKFFYYATSKGGEVWEYSCDKFFKLTGWKLDDYVRRDDEMDDDSRIFL